MNYNWKKDIKLYVMFFITIVKNKKNKNIQIF